MPFVSQQHVLFNDSALALQVPYADRARAHRLAHDFHRASGRMDLGHRAADAPRRRACLLERAHLGSRPPSASCWTTCKGPPAASRMRRATQLSFQPGYRREFWHRNCVAIGLSAGFIEPLEASALALVELSAAMLSDEMPATRAAMDIVARRFNDFFTYRWERVIDFLKLHYVLEPAGRSAVLARQPPRAESIPDRLRGLLALWRHQPPSRYDLHRVEEVFPSASYQYVLYGMGFQARGRKDSARRSDDADRADGLFPRSRPAHAPDARRAAVQPRSSSNTSGTTGYHAHDHATLSLNNVEHRDLRVIPTRHGARYRRRRHGRAHLPRGVSQRPGALSHRLHRAPDGSFTPLALFGFREKQNLFLKGDTLGCARICR